MPASCLRYIPIGRAPRDRHCVRGGSILAKWCLAHHQETSRTRTFREICEDHAAYDVSSRSATAAAGVDRGCDDEAQFARAEDAGRAEPDRLEYDVQVMNGARAHSMHLIKENMEKQLEWCQEAPFYTLGP